MPTKPPSGGGQAPTPPQTAEEHYLQNPYDFNIWEPLGAPGYSVSHGPHPNATDTTTTDPIVLGGGGGGGSGGSSGPTAAQLQVMHDAAVASFREVLRRWGIPATKNLMNLIEKATKLGWNSTLFVDHLRHTPEYHQKFPGMNYGSGMTEATYNSTYNSYRAQAKLIGETLDRTTFARALKNGVTPEEFKARTTAVDSMISWAPMLEGFKETLAANGLVDKAANVSQANIMKMAMGMGPKRWEELWQETVVGVNLERVAGVTVGDPPKGWGINDPNKQGGGSPVTSVDQDWMHITRNDMLTLINQVESVSPGFQVEDMTGQQWRDIGARMRQFKGSYLAKYGITAKDLLEMELGGPRAAAIADKSQKILAEQTANADPRAVPQDAQQVGQPQSGYRDLPQAQ